MRFDFQLGVIVGTLAVAVPGAFAGTLVTAAGLPDAGTISLVSYQNVSLDAPAETVRPPRSFTLPMAFDHPAAGHSRADMSPIQAAPTGGASDNLYVDWVSPLQAPADVSAEPSAETGPVPATSHGAAAPTAGAHGPAPAAAPRAEAVPEPSALSLLATAMLPLAGMAWRCRRKDRA